MEVSMTRPLVIKIGGAIMESDQALSDLFKVVSQLQQDRGVIIVHGGGCVADDMLQQAGFVSKKIDGLRVSEQAHMAVISGALAGTVNKHMVAIANHSGLKTVGLALHDGQSIVCLPADPKLGCVGIPQAGNASLLNSLVAANCLPLISSIGSLDNGTLVNVNADDAAVAISELLNADLVLLTDVAGVKGADQKYLATLDGEQAKHLIEQGVIAGGMIAKVNAAFAAANRLRRSIAVASWKSPEKLFVLNSNGEFGTRIIPTL
ncbi:acetylglutamate kinase [Thalassotalea sp. Y01]|nr:acetylglutamate kinase [Thalassotalea sp. Y01]